MMAFMCLTQERINNSMTARAFLEEAGAVPQSSIMLLCTTLAATLAFVLLGHLYRKNKNRYERYFLFAAEVIVCMFLMRVLNLSYDGVVLLVAADLMFKHEGHRQEYTLLIALICLYVIANYNLAIFRTKIISFEAYVSYYNADAAAVLLAIKNTFYSLNIVCFVFYLVLLVKSTHEEKERIRLLNERLEEANQRLRAYAIEVAQMAETRERNRLAREIHDTLGHALTGIAAGLDACIMMLEVAPEATKQQLNKIRDTARKGITDVRRSVKKLRPDVLERLPFQEALLEMTKDYSESSGMEITFDIFSWPNNLRQDQEDVIYRVLQESITNAKRHGHATKVKITIGGNENYLLIVIADNGLGCEEVKHGFGLKHMRERLELLHGTIHYWSDEGFIVEAMIPLNREAEHDKNSDSR
ncbi:MAG: sensor histidine kinase [Selenomonadaceae bacterium]|nr:sensor histidine kinase [Selenomonadaceae bacterium]MBR7024872.1 sensor histidine kinase [Selenomonadaceae bacterium]